MLDPSLPVLQTSAHAHARIGDVEGAMKTVAGMSQSTMGTFTRDQSVKQIVTTLLEKSDIAGARRTVELIPDSGSFTVSKADVVEQIAKRQAEQGDAAGAHCVGGSTAGPRDKAPRAARIGRRGRPTLHRPRFEVSCFGYKPNPVEVIRPAD